MSQEVYGRRYSLIVGRPERIEYSNTQPPASIAKPKKYGEYPKTLLSRDVNSVSCPASYGEDRTVIPAEFMEWTTTQFTAEVVSTKQGSKDNDTNTTIKLWNLSKEEQLFIKRGYSVILRAGYNQDITGVEPPPGISNPDYEAKLKTLGSVDLPLIFTGEVLRATTEKQGQDTITTLVCSDGGFAFKGIRISETYSGELTYKELIESVIRTGTIYGVRMGEIYLVDSLDLATSSPDTSFLTDKVIDMTVHGYFIDELNSICNSVGHKAYFCLGKVYVEPKYQTTAKPVVKVRNEETLYYIRWEESFNGFSEGAETEANSVKLACPLDGRLNVVSTLKIEEGEYNGDRDIVSVIHKMDYEGTEWDTVIVSESK
jgi:hypothetical protein